MEATGSFLGEGGRAGVVAVRLCTTACSSLAHHVGPVARQLQPLVAQLAVYAGKLKPDGALFLERSLRRASGKRARHTHSVGAPGSWR